MDANAFDSIDRVGRVKARPNSDSENTSRSPPAKRFWNRYAKSYSSVENLYPHRRMIRDVADLIPSSADSVLDVGCGSGALLQLLGDERTSRSLHGIDFSEAMLEVTADRVPHALLKQGDFNEKLPFADSTFDCVVSSNALYTVKSPSKFIEELLRVTKEEGVVIITTPKHQAKGAQILLNHWKHAGLLAGLFDLIKFTPCIFFNLLIEHHARERNYHFLTNSELHGLADAVTIQPDTFAGQNWLFSIRKATR